MTEAEDILEARCDVVLSVEDVTLSLQSSARGLPIHDKDNRNSTHQNQNYGLILDVMIKEIQFYTIL